MRVTNAYSYQHSRARFDALEYAYLATSTIPNDDKFPSNLNAVIRVRSLGPPEGYQRLTGATDILEYENPAESAT